MKHALMAAVCAMGTGVMASELDVQPGQWALHLKPTTAGYNIETSKLVTPSSSTTDLETSTVLQASVAGEYRFSNSLLVGGSASYINFKINGNRDVDGTETIDTTARTSLYTANPFLRYYVNDSFALQAEVAYSGTPAAESTDIDGDKTNLTTEGYETDLLGGFVYRSDLKPNVLMSLEAMGGIRTTYNEDPDDREDTEKQQEYVAEATLDFNYFLATNFSVNAGLSASYGQLFLAEDDGVELDLNDTEISQLDYGTRFGFTYYHR